MKDKTKLKFRYTSFNNPRSLECSPVLYCYTIAHAHSHTVADHAMTALTLIRAVFLETDKRDVTLIIHSWIYYYLSTVLDVVQPGSTKNTDVIHSE